MGCICSRERKQDVLLAPSTQNENAMPQMQEATAPVTNTTAAAIDAQFHAWKARSAAARAEAATVFRAAQYNILASYLGDNRQPWFLYGVDLTDERRAQILALFYATKPDGSYANAGWPHYVRGVLSEEEQRAVETVDASHFAWAVRRDALLTRILSTEAEVLSLVELDEYEQFFRPRMREHGYDSVWQKRPRDASADG